MASSTKVQCRECRTVSDRAQWVEVEFWCDDCADDHEGVRCPGQGCQSVEGPGRIGYVEL